MALTLFQDDPAVQVNLNGDLGDAGIVYLSKFKITHTRTGRELRFTEHTPEIAPTFAKRQIIHFHDDGTRRFFGYVVENNPQGHEVEYVCLDPMHRLHEILAIDADGLPRLVFNVRMDDPDWPDSISNIYRPDIDTEHGPPPHNVNELWLQILQIHSIPITTQLPGLPVGDPWDEGTAQPPGGGSATAALSDLGKFGVGLNELHEDTAFEPERVIFEEQTLGDVFEELLQFTPAFEMHFDPVDQKFRWIIRVDTGGSSPMSAKTVTLNDGTGPHTVLAKEIADVATDRWTKVEIVGPPEEVPVLAYLDAGAGTPHAVPFALEELWDSGLESSWSVFEARDNESATTDNPNWHVYRRYRIIDAAKRRMLRYFRQGLFLPGLSAKVDLADIGAGPDHARRVEYFNLTQFTRHRPTLAAKMEVDGRIAWFHIKARFDLVNGIAIAENPIVIGDIRDPLATHTKPLDVVLAYAYRDLPTLASYGHAGTANTILGITNTARFYEQDFFSNTIQKPNYDLLAKALWRTRADVVWSGSAVLHGHDYSWEGMQPGEENGRVNFGAIDDSGNPLVTGWEAIDAPVQEIEYDYEANTTQISLNSDMAEYVFGDYETLRLRVMEAAVQNKEIAFFRSSDGSGSSGSAFFLGGGI